MSDWDDYGDNDDQGYSDDDADSGDEWKEELKDPYKPSYNDRERAGGIIGCWMTGQDNQPLKTQTPLGRFCLRVDAISRNIDDESKCNFSKCNFKIPGDQIQTLLDKSQTLPRVQFKNATAFVLGYLATAKGTRNITKDTLNNVWACYESIAGIKDSSITKPDIIRYARLIMEK